MKFHLQKIIQVIEHKPITHDYFLCVELLECGHVVENKHSTRKIKCDGKHSQADKRHCRFCFHNEKVFNTYPHKVGLLVV